MSIRRFAAIALASSLLALAPRARADEKVPGIRGEMIANLNHVGGELVQLAEAIPADKYSWRPGEGVRSVAEVFMHVATANYSIPKFIGANPPDKTGFEMEKQITEKAKVIEFLKGSLDFLKKTIASTSDADLEKTAKYFGMENSHRATFLLIVSHNHEHLGQAIAYARMNKITPPWSKAEAAPHEAKPADKK